MKDCKFYYIAEILNKFMIGIGAILAGFGAYTAGQQTNNFLKSVTSVQVRMTNHINVGAAATMGALGTANTNNPDEILARINNPKRGQLIWEESGVFPGLTEDQARELARIEDFEDRRTYLEKIYRERVPKSGWGVTPFGTGPFGDPTEIPDSKKGQ